MSFRLLPRCTVHIAFFRSRCILCFFTWCNFSAPWWAVFKIFRKMNSHALLRAYRHGSSITLLLSLEVDQLYKYIYIYNWKERNTLGENSNSGRFILRIFSRSPREYLQNATVESRFQKRRGESWIFREREAWGSSYPVGEAWWSGPSFKDGWMTVVVSWEGMRRVSSCPDRQARPGW